MSRRWLVPALALALAFAPAAAPEPAQAARTLSLSGSSTTLAVVADLAYFYRRETPRAPRFTIVGGGTETGIADAARRIVDAGLVSRALTRADPRGLRFTPIALSGICLVTNRSNPLGNLTRAQVQELLAGRIANWSQLPGSPRTDAPAPASYDGTAGARGVFASVFVDPLTPIAIPAHRFRTATQMRTYVAATPAGWGYVDVAFTRGLHRVAYEGVPCKRRTIRSGAYAARRELGIVTRGRPRGELARFLRWIARDRTARRVIATRYVVP